MKTSPRTIPYPENLYRDVFGLENMTFMPSDAVQRADLAISSLLDHQGRRKDGYRLCVTRRYKEHKTYQEIADELGQTAARAQQNVWKSIRMLRHPSRRNILLDKKGS